MNWITEKLYKYYMQKGNFSHTTASLTTLLILYYGLVITEKSKHTVFKLISISVSSLNELSQSGFFWLVGFCYQASSEPCQQPQQCDIRYKQEHASSSDSPTYHLVPLCHAGFCLHKLLMKHQDGSVARGIIDFAMTLQHRCIQASKGDKRSVRPLAMKIGWIAINRLPGRKTKVGMYILIDLIKGRPPSDMKISHLIG